MSTREVELARMRAERALLRREIKDKRRKKQRRVMFAALAVAVGLIVLSSIVSGSTC